MTNKSEPIIGYIIDSDIGNMEVKTKLLIESIIRVKKSTDKVYVVKPNKIPYSNDTYSFFNQYNIVVEEIQMNDFWNQNMMMSKIFILYYIENLFAEEVDFFLFIDTDTLFLNPLSDSELYKHLLCLRPTDFADASLSEKNRENKIWGYLLEKFMVYDYKDWALTTTVDQQACYASFNSGFILVSSKISFFKKWYSLANAIKNDSQFLNLLKNMRMFEHYLDQILFTLVVLKYFSKSDVLILDSKYNFSLESMFHGRKLHYSRDCPYLGEKIVLDELTHIHYHDKFRYYSSRKLFKKSQIKNIIYKYVPINFSIRASIIQTIGHIYFLFRIRRCK